MFDTGLRTSASRRFRRTSCLKAETRIYKGISQSNCDWRPLILTCCKHAKQPVRLREMKTFECPGYYSWFNNYFCNSSHYGEKTEKPTSFAISLNIDITPLQYFFREEMEETRRQLFDILRNIKTHIH